MREFASDLWFRLTVRAFSMAELIGALALLAFKAPAWVIAVVGFPWLIWRHRRNNDATPF